MDGAEAQTFCIINSNQECDTILKLRLNPDTERHTKANGYDNTSWRDVQKNTEDIKRDESVSPTTYTHTEINNFADQVERKINYKKNHTRNGPTRAGTITL